MIGLARLRRASPWLVAALAMLSIVRVSAQTLTIKTAGDVLHVMAAGFTFLDGPVFDRLHDGRSAQVDLELSVLTRPRGPVIARDTQRFNVSLDLWEERFAVSHVGTPVRVVSHLRAIEAEAWCVDALAVSVAPIVRHSRDAPFWLRLEYRLPDPPAADGNGDSAFTLRSLIDRLSRKPQKIEPGKTLEAGPFRLSN